MHPTVAFADVERALAAGASAVHPAEAHGCLCGALCLRPDYSLADWLGEVLPDVDAGAAARAAADGPFAALFGETAGVLARPDMEFEPLLPGDKAVLADRVAALAAWCAGFLFGFGGAGTASQAAASATVDEVLADLAQISHAGAVGSESADVEEDAYVELVEFVRAGVQLVYEELASLRAQQPPTRSGQ
jgi:hypothetical protein